MLGEICIFCAYFIDSIDSAPSMKNSYFDLCPPQLKLIVIQRNRQKHKDQDYGSPYNRQRPKFNRVAYPIRYRDINILLCIAYKLQDHPIDIPEIII